MTFSEKSLSKIKRLLANHPNTQEKLLLGEIGAIKEILLIIAQERINPEEIITAYDNNLLNELYEKAKYLIELQSLYQELSNEYYYEMIKLSDAELKTKQTKK